MRRLRLGFSIADQSLRHSKSIGILNVSEGLLGSLAARPEFSELMVFANSSLVLPEKTAVKITAQNHDAAAKGRWARMRWDQRGVYRAAQAAGCDWLFLPKGFASFLARPPVRLAVYIHDAMHDFYRSHYPQGLASFEKRYFALGYRAALRDAEVIFTNSEFTAAEVKRMAQKLGLPSPRVVTAGIGFAPVSVTASKQELVTVLVSRWPHKLTARALDWLGRWQTQNRYAGTIHLVGDLPAGTTVPSFSNWKLLARLSGMEFDDTIARSRVLIYFSEYEGFGMPPIEAIFRGTAPVYSRIPAMMETTGGAGFPFDNVSYDSFSAALDHALACPRPQIESWSRALAQRHTWARVAERIALALAQHPRGQNA
jgi:glycosyltransferase involved in cell wall biosynthesis